MHLSCFLTISVKFPTFFFSPFHICIYFSHLPSVANLFILFRPFSSNFSPFCRPVFIFCPSTDMSWYSTISSCYSRKVRGKNGLCSRKTNLKEKICLDQNICRLLTIRARTSSIYLRGFSGRIFRRDAILLWKTPVLQFSSTGSSGERDCMRR
jgi:hypothetical protein